MPADVYPAISSAGEPHYPPASAYGRCQAGRRNNERMRCRGAVALAGSLSASVGLCRAVQRHPVGVACSPVEGEQQHVLRSFDVGGDRVGTADPRCRPAGATCRASSACRSRISSALASGGVGGPVGKRTARVVGRATADLFERRRVVVVLLDEVLQVVEDPLPFGQVRTWRGSGWFILWVRVSARSRWGAGRRRRSGRSTRFPSAARQLDSGKEPAALMIAAGCDAGV